MVEPTNAKSALSSERAIVTRQNGRTDPILTTKPERSMAHGRLSEKLYDRQTKKSRVDGGSVAVFATVLNKLCREAGSEPDDFRQDVICVAHAAMLLQGKCHPNIRHGEACASDAFDQTAIVTNTTVRAGSPFASGGLIISLISSLTWGRVRRG